MVGGCHPGGLSGLWAFNPWGHPGQCFLEVFPHEIANPSKVFIGQHERHSWAQPQLSSEQHVLPDANYRLD